MKTCTFFGHRECPDSLRPRLKAAVEALICREGVERFYVGNQGRFDAMALGVLRELSGRYPHIGYGVVLAYPPERSRDVPPESMFPEEMEQVMPKYAIARRNDWMLHRADWVITYITHTWGGAARYGERARKQGKQILSLAPEPGAALESTVFSAKIAKKTL